MACGEEGGGLAQHRPQMQAVNETLNDGYCDVSGDLILQTISATSTANNCAQDEMEKIELHFSKGIVARVRQKGVTG